MSKVLEEMREEAAEKAAAKADHDRRVKVAVKMLRDGLDYQTIVNYSELPLEEVEELAGENVQKVS